MICGLQRVVWSCACASPIRELIEQGTRIALFVSAMRTLIHEHRARVSDTDGTVYTARTYAEERFDGTWYAWLEFEPDGFGRLTLHTEQETSQPNQSAVTYWATGLQRIYLEGAFGRAHL